MVDNMKLWNFVCDTNPEFTKRVKLGGYSFTDIDIMYSIKRATELWGPFGSTWGLKQITYNFGEGYIENKEKIKEKVPGILMQGIFWYPGGEFDIAADLPYETRGETLKKLQTMCIGKALSRLGFSADIYEGRFDDSAYVKAQEEKYAETNDSNDSNHSATVVDNATKNEVVVNKPKAKKYPEPDPVASGILGALCQRYQTLLDIDDMKDLKLSHVVSFKKVCNAVYDAFGRYPTRMDSIPKLLETVPLDKVIEKNDFLDGVN